jgi:glycosyltransferase involved in cell wall biosynthesis
MRHSARIIVVTQHYPPDPTTTATYLAAIAGGLAAEKPVLVISGTRGSASDASPRVVEIASWKTRKGALVGRAVAMTLFAVHAFWATLMSARRGDVVFTLTSPFTMPYGVLLAARLRGAAAALLIYDLFPEALVMSGLARPDAIVARITRLANGALFRSLDAIITIGRDVKPMLLAYSGVDKRIIHFIPNWSLLPVGYRPPMTDNPYRPKGFTGLVVGLSGNLGYTHSAETVLLATRLLADHPNVHFLLSGWGVGWKALDEALSANPCRNVTLVPPVLEGELTTFLAAADLWVIPYRRGVAGVSVPSRLYNLLAVGRAIIVAAEAHSEASMVVTEENIGWAVAPEQPQALADAIAAAAADMPGTVQKGRHAAEVASRYSPEAGLAAYRAVLMPLVDRASRR